MTIPKRRYFDQRSTSPKDQLGKPQMWEVLAGDWGLRVQRRREDCVMGSGKVSSSFNFSFFQVSSLLGLRSGGRRMERDHMSGAMISKVSRVLTAWAVWCQFVSEERICGKGGWRDGSV